jgi:hypothetical protein
LQPYSLNKYNRPESPPPKIQALLTIFIEPIIAGGQLNTSFRKSDYGMTPMQRCLSRKTTIFQSSLNIRFARLLFSTERMVATIESAQVARQVRKNRSLS